VQLSATLLSRNVVGKLFTYTYIGRQMVVMHCGRKNKVQVL